MANTWEADFLRAAAEGDGVALPYGTEPFSEILAIGVRFDPERGLVVWGEPDGRVYLMDAAGRRLIGDFPPVAYTYSLDLHPNKEEALLCAATGAVYVLTPEGPILLDAAHQAVEAWYASGGDSVYVYSRDRSELILIDLGSQQVIWRLPTGGGTVLHAASSPDDVALFHQHAGSWSMSPISAEGEVGTPRALPKIDKNVLSYDRDGESVALGTYDGLVHVHTAGAWREMRCSESMQVFQVRLVSSENRVFVATPADIEVFELSSGLATITLGGRDTHHQGVQRIDWHEDQRSLIALSVRGVTSWSAGPLP